MAVNNRDNVKVDWTIIFCCLIIVMMIVMTCRVVIGVNDSINSNKGKHESIKSHSWDKG